MGLMEIAEFLLSETPDWKSAGADLILTGLFYWFFYFISLLVYRYVELAKEQPQEEP